MGLLDVDLLPDCDASHERAVALSAFVTFFGLVAMLGSFGRFYGWNGGPTGLAPVD